MQMGRPDVQDSRVLDGVAPAAHQGPASGQGPAGAEPAALHFAALRPPQSAGLAAQAGLPARRGEELSPSVASCYARRPCMHLLVVGLPISGGQWYAWFACCGLLGVGATLRACCCKSFISAHSNASCPLPPRSAVACRCKWRLRASWWVPFSRAGASSQ